MNDDKRLFENYLPIVAISAEASREKSVRKGHISTLHLWLARRPLVALGQGAALRLQVVADELVGTVKSTAPSRKRRKS
jgi:adenine-specific DNA methylase